MSGLEVIPSFAWRWPRLILLAALAVVSAALFMLPKTHLQFDLYESNDENFAAVRNLRSMKNAFSDSHRADLSFQLKDEPTAGEICRAFGILRRLQETSPAPFRTETLWDVRRVLSEPGRLTYPPILASPCALAGTDKVIVDRQAFLGGPGELLLPADDRQFRVAVTFAEGESSVTAMSRELDRIQAEMGQALGIERTDVLGVFGFRYAFYQAFKRDAAIAAGSVVGIALLLWLLIGSLRGVLVYLGIAGFAIVTLVGLMAALGASIDFLTNSLILMLLIACLSDYLFIAFRSPRGLRESFAAMAVPSSLTALTTIIGFIALNSSDLASIRAFGTWAAVGVFLEWLATFAILPALCAWRKWDFPLVDEKRAWKPRLFDFLRHAKPSPIWLAAALAAMALGVPSFYFLNFRDEPLRNFPKGHPFRVALEKQSLDEGWEGTAFVMIPAGVSAEQERDVTRTLRAWPGTARLVTGEDMLSSMTSRLSHERREMVSREANAVGALRSWRSRDGTKRHLLLLKSYDSDSVQDIDRRISEVCRDCFLAGQSLVYAEYNRRLGSTLTSGFVESLVSVVILLLALTWLKEPGLYGPILVSILVGPLAMVTLIALLGIPVNVVTCVFFAVIVGLTGDNAIQFLFSEGKTFQDKMHDRSEASLVMTLMLMALSSMFLFQTLVPVKWLGALFLLGFAVTFFGDLNVLQGLIERRERRRNPSEARQ